MAKKRVLIVDDQYLIVQYLSIWVEAFGHDVCGTAGSASAAVDAALELKPDCILMDMRLDGAEDGVDAALKIHPQHACPIIYITGSSEPSTADKIATDHAFATLIKPIDPQQLGALLQAI